MKLVLQNYTPYLLNLVCLGSSILQEFADDVPQPGEVHASFLVYGSHYHQVIRPEGFEQQKQEEIQGKEYQEHADQRGNGNADDIPGYAIDDGNG
jgi:hypothetical protein